MNDEIKLLRFPESVRQRIGMYLGGAESTDTMLREIIDNAIDECGYSANYICIDRDLIGTGLRLVADNGRGLPIALSSELHEGREITQAELSICTLHSGSKFTDNKMATVGQNGVGSAAVNATSSDYIVLSKINESNWSKSTQEVRDLWESAGPRSKKDLYYIVWYKQGYRHYEGAHKLSDIEKKIFGKTSVLPAGMSTLIMFCPDPEIFSKAAMKTNIPIENLQYFLLIQDKFYKKKVTINIEGTEFTSSGFELYRSSMMKTIIPADTSLNEKIDLFVTVEYDPDLGKKVLSGSVNSLSVDEGVHLDYVESCFIDAVKEHFKIKHRYTSNGLKLKVIATASELTFSSQTKEKLKAFTRVKKTDFSPLVKDFIKLFKSDSIYWGEYADKLNLLADSMKALSASDKAQKMIDSATGNSVYRNKTNLVDGFADATLRDRWECELFLCEGNSAAGTLKSSRRAEKGGMKHAVLPLRGKILNVSDKTIDQALSNKEINTIFSILGVGIQEKNVTSECKTIEEAYETLKKYSRYGKICISTDSDSDGSQISALILYLFSKYARFLIDLGCVYLSLSPLYEQSGNYYYIDSPIDQKTGFPVGLNPSKPFRRWKGLGSIPKELGYDAFFNPDTRRLVRVTSDGIDYAMSLVEDISQRKSLLIDSGIIANPYNFTD